ncbi:MAG: site-specific DNA-methyltransferase, partial [Synergistaceae bacterium]|nr:site-specific DNA-methyltransferase [Synergistaceae bacterium]
MSWEKLKMQTPDLRAENFKKLAELFPDAVTETITGYDDNGKAIIKRAVDADVLRRAISAEVIDGDVKERYNFTWPDKQRTLALAMQPNNKTLRLVRDKSVGRDGTPGSIDTENIYIEGDNLDALKILQETYLGKIKMIYIDPPYNTGSDLIYNDKFLQDEDEFLINSGQADERGNRLVANNKTSGRFHTDWLNMIYPRLKFAKELLSDDGVIFISIDDNEQANLKKICDEIFGECNFKSLITIIANPGGRDYGGIAKTTEYILVYTKQENDVLKKVADENHIFTMRDELGSFEIRELRNRNTVFNDKNRPNLCYPFYVNPNDKDEYGLLSVALEEDAEHNVKVMPLVSNGIQTVWRWGKEEKSRANLNINIKGKQKQDGSYMIVEKYRDENVMVKNTWLDKKFRTENGSIQMKDLFNAKDIFPYPKPIEITYLLSQMATDPDSIILDFFSGSATTAHAVMKLNSEDGGRRKFILVQLPELTPENSEARKAGYETICDIGEERIKRAGKKIKEERPLDFENL